MKEIIEGLNLPKQVLDKTEKLMSKLFGSSITEFGEIFADNIKFRRLKNQIKILNKTRELLDKNGLEPKELNLKTLVPILENSSIEEDPTLQEKWAHLIANIATSKESGIESRLVATLSSLSSLEARILDFIYEDFDAQRKLTLAKLLNKTYKYTEEDINVDSIVIYNSLIKEEFDLSNEFADIYLNNLVSLGLLKFEDPEVEVNEGDTSADIDDDEDIGPTVDLNLDISAYFHESDNIHLTSYGLHFIEKCKAD